MLEEAKRLSGPITGDGWDNWGVYALIQRQPTADVVEVRHGRWIEQPLDFDLCGVAYYQCSECGKEQQTPSNYCQFCGARNNRQKGDAKMTDRYVLKPQSDYEGLKRKYVVLKSDTGECVENCFVLRPDKDQAAKAALMAYAAATKNEKLAEDIMSWLSSMDGGQDDGD